MRTTSCPECGAEVSALKFCDQCGAALVQAEPPQDNSAERAGEGSFDYHVTGRRIVAALIDLALLVLLFIIMSAVSGNVGGWSIYVEDGFVTVSNYTDDSTQDGGNAAALYIYFFLALSYHIVMERVAAATLGKMIMGLTVVKVGGAQYGWIPVLIRNILRIIDGLPIFYLVGFIFVAVTPKNQRLGDFAAGTLVVRTPVVEPSGLLPGRASDAATGGPPDHRMESVAAPTSQPPPTPPRWTDTLPHEPEARRFPWVWAIAGGVAGAIVVGIVLALTLGGGDGGGFSEAEEHFKKGVELQEQKRFQEALAEFDEAIRRDPHSAVAYYGRGNAYYDVGQFQRGIEDLDDAIRLDPGDGGAYNNRGAAYGNLGQFQRSIEDFDEAIRLDPVDAEAYNNRGLAYTRLGQFHLAIQDIDEAVRLDPGNGLAYANRAVAHTFLNNDEAAQRDVERAHQLGFDEDQLNELIERSKRQR